MGTSIRRFTLEDFLGVDRHALTCEHIEAAEKGLAQQSRVVGAQLQQHCQVPLSAIQVHLSHVHHGGPLNDEELDKQQAVVVAHCLKGKLTLFALFIMLTC